jgi:uncharacterized protein YndB with AHSA1/START domain
MSNERFVYVIYIASTPQKVWDAVVRGDLTRQYWGHENVSDWKRGSKWQHVTADDARTVRTEGEVLESVPPKRLVLTWGDPEEAADRRTHSRMTLTVEPVKDMVRLTVVHEELGSKMLEKISQGWPRVLSSLKSFLETGRPLETWA